MIDVQPEPSPTASSRWSHLTTEAGCTDDCLAHISAGEPKVTEEPLLDLIYKLYKNINQTRCADHIKKDGVSLSLLQLRLLLADIVWCVCTSSALLKLIMNSVGII